MALEFSPRGAEIHRSPEYFRIELPGLEEVPYADSILPRSLLEQLPGLMDRNTAVELPPRGWRNATKLIKAIESAEMGGFVTAELREVSGFRYTLYNRLENGIDDPMTREYLANTGQTKLRNVQEGSFVSGMGEFNVAATNIDPYVHLVEQLGIPDALPYEELLMTGLMHKIPNGREEGDFVSSIFMTNRPGVSGYFYMQQTDYDGQDSAEYDLAICLYKDRTEAIRLPSSHILESSYSFQAHDA